MTPEQEAIKHLIQAVNHLNERTITVTGTSSAQWIADELYEALKLIQEEKETQ